MRNIALLSAALLTAWASPAFAESQAVHRIVEPDNVPWTTGPATIPGSKVAVLYGDPSKPELFVMRLWLPANFRIAPHTHPKPEILTVISGSFRLGMGTVADKANTRLLGPGAFSAMAPDTPHFGFSDTGGVLQISTVGPWTINFVNPADGPRPPVAPATERGGH